MSRHFRLLGLALTTALLGCGSHEEQVTPPPVPPPAARKPQAPTASPAQPLPPDHPAAANSTKHLTPPKPKPSVASLAEALKEYSTATDPARKSQLIADVGNMSGTTAEARDVLQVLTQMLKGEAAPTMRAEIVEELGLLETPGALDPILEATAASQPEEVRKSAIDAADTLLSDLASAENKAGMLPIILRAVDARYPTEVRVAAISALEDLENKDAIPHLQKLLQDPNPEVKEAAQSAIDWLQE